MSGYPHDYNDVNLGHALGYCRYCGGTPGEISVTGDLNHCPVRERNEKEGSAQREEVAYGDWFVVGDAKRVGTAGEICVLIDGGYEANTIVCRMALNGRRNIDDSPRIGHCVNSEEDLARAHMIARAVNCHAAFLEVLKALVNDMDTADEVRGVGTGTRHAATMLLRLAQEPAPVRGSETGRCQIVLCTTGAPAAVHVSEIIGDGAFRVGICQRCADGLGLSENDNLPDLATVEEMIGERG